MRKFAVFTLMVFCALLLVEKAEACLCSPAPLSFKIKHANFIFVGRVKVKTEDKENYWLKTGFQIEKVWKLDDAPKWNLGNEITIDQGTRFYCWMEFEVGKRYFIFANTFTDKSGGLTFTTNFCNGNEMYSKKFLRQMENEFTKLKKAKRLRFYGNQSNRLRTVTT